MTSQLAEAMAARLAASASFDDARKACEAEYRALLEAVKKADARFAFDPDGRPGAVEAVRRALPVMEAELFDAVLEDHACEVAAIEEALYQLALACSRRRD